MPTKITIVFNLSPKGQKDSLIFSHLPCSLLSIEDLLILLKAKKATTPRTHSLKTNLKKRSIKFRHPKFKNISRSTTLTIARVLK